MADLLNVVTPISTIQENASNAWKRLGQIKGFLTGLFTLHGRRRSSPLIGFSV